MFKKVITICLLLSNSLHFSMHRYITTKLPANLQAYIPKRLQTAAPIDTQNATTANLDKQELLKKVQDLLKQQPSQYHQTFKEHPAYQEFETLKLSAAVQTDLVLQQKIMILHEILQYCQEHPEQTKDIMTFYNQMKQADTMLKEKLAQQPQHFQDFFNQQLQQYMQAPYHYKHADGSKWTKERILRLFSIVLLTIIYTKQILDIIINLKDIDLDKELLNIIEDIEKSEHEELLNVIELLQDALDLTTVPFKKIHKTSKIAAINNVLNNNLAIYNSSLHMIVLCPNFFKQSPEAQLHILLHEMRHTLQFTKAADLLSLEETLEYAKTCINCKSKFKQLWNMAFFWSSALQIPNIDSINWSNVTNIDDPHKWPKPFIEFDADNFAYEQLKELPSFEQIVKQTAWNKFDPKKGYFSKEMALKKMPKQKSTPTLQSTEETTNTQPSTPYMQNIPEHLKQAAAKNRTARAQLAPQQPTETLLDRYLKKIEAEL